MTREVLFKPRYQPRHRRCTQYHHHVWEEYGGRGVGGWGVCWCVFCGEPEIY